MRSKKFDNTYIVRINKGEELVKALEDFCKENNIKAGTIQGIGATNQITIGYFDTSKKEYFSKEFKGNFEMAPLIGNITSMEGKTYLHLHVTFGDEDFNSHSGHLSKAMISATFEAVITKLDGEQERYYDDGIGLNLLKF